MDRANRTVAFALLALCMVAVICNIRLVRASGPIYIRADGTVDPSGAPIQRNGDLYTLTDNITSNADGIVVEKSDTTVDGAGFTVQGSVSGNAFYVYGISNLTIRNVKTEGFSYGIYLESTSRNIIYGNNLAGSTYDGIGLFDSIDNIISFNHMKENGWSGVNLYFSSGNNISGNSITNNYYGISMYSSENSSIFHNNFINNTDQISSDSSPNVWDNGYPSGGNYWSDYSGVDSNGDGIGDTPYAIDENNQDRYPLMKPWTNIVVSEVTSPRNIVGQGYSSYTYVSVQNQGWNTETIDITIYANTTPTIQEQMTLASRSSVNATLIWDSSSLSKGNYTISAIADTVPGETDTADNSLTDGWAVITIIGDINGDFKVDIKDLVLVIKYFGSYPSHPKWNPNADVNSDGKVDIKDLVLVIKHFGEHYP